MGRFFAALVLIFWAPMALAQDSYRIQPGDTLQIEVLEDASLNRTVLVLPDGRFAFPNAGTQRAGGRTIGQVRNGLVGALTPLFAAPPTVYVNIAALAAPEVPLATEEATIDIYVVGEVTNPGKRAVEPGTTMLQFLAEMGGFSKFAATKRIQLRRNEKGGSQRVVNFNYRAIERGTVQARHIHLREGDVIVVPTRRLFE